MRVRVVVADQSKALFYDVEHADSNLEPAGEIVDPLAHLHDRDFKSDRPGRIFNRAPGSDRHGAVVHHAAGGENTPRKHETEIFARKVAHALEDARREHEFDRLVLMANPVFLGALREEIPPALRQTIVAEVNKNLVRQDERAIRNHLPPETFEQFV